MRRMKVCPGTDGGGQNGGDDGDVRPPDEGCVLAWVYLELWSDPEQLQWMKGGCLC